MAEAVEAPGRTALLIIDMINALDFEDAAPLLKAAEAAVGPILKRRDAADAAGVPVIYINDNDDEWHSERSRLIEKVTESDAPGREITRRIKPRDNDYFIIKPQFSGFYSTNLPVLLPRLGVSRLVLTGVAADICVLFTAADAHMREYDLWVPEDSVASSDRQRTQWALEIMRNSMDADTDPAGERSLEEWIAKGG